MLSSDKFLGRYQQVRLATEALANRFTEEQQLVQSMPDASPIKWHLTHTTWFFERMVLRAAVADYAPVDDRYDFLFNSYYEAVGERQPRPLRSLTTSPTLREVRAYRQIIDGPMREVIPSLNAALREIARLGCEHEQQHQELILTDVKNGCARPTYPSKSARSLLYGRFHRRRDPAPSLRTKEVWLSVVQTKTGLRSTTNGRVTACLSSPLSWQRAA